MSSCEQRPTWFNRHFLSWSGCRTSPPVIHREQRPRCQQVPVLPWHCRQALLATCCSAQAPRPRNLLPRDRAFCTSKKKATRKAIDGVSRVPRSSFHKTYKCLRSWLLPEEANLPGPSLRLLAHGGVPLMSPRTKSLGSPAAWQRPTCSFWSFWW